MKTELSNEAVVLRHFFVNDEKKVRNYKFHNTGEEEIVRRRYNECTIALYHSSEKDIMLIGWAKLGKKENQFNRKLGKQIAMSRLKFYYSLLQDNPSELENPKYAIPEELTDIIVKFVEDTLDKMSRDYVEGNPKRKHKARKSVLRKQA